MVINPVRQTPQLLKAASDAGVPGVRGRGGGQPIVIDNHITFSLGTETVDRIYSQGVRSQNTRKATGQALSNLARYG
jgi:hypothetical protein